MMQHQLFVLAFFLVLLVLFYQIAVIFSPFLSPSCGPSSSPV